MDKYTKVHSVVPFNNLRHLHQLSTFLVHKMIARSFMQVSLDLHILHEKRGCDVRNIHILIDISDIFLQVFANGREFSTAHTDHGEAIELCRIYSCRGELIGYVGASYLTKSS